MIFFTAIFAALMFLVFFGYLLKGNKTLLIIFTLISCLFIRSFIVQAYKIPAGSMLPTLFIGDRILTNKFIYKFISPSQGDLIIFPFPKDPTIDYVKRVIATGGDILEIKEKSVYVNGELLTEPYTKRDSSNLIEPSVSPRDYLGPIKIPENQVFVLGDNRDNSYDSRFWGFVNQDTIKAKVEIVYWSSDIETEKIRWERFGKILN